MNTVPSNPFRRITPRSFFRQFSLGLCWLAAALPLVAGETTNSTAVRTAAVGSQSYADFGRGYIPTPHMRQARPAGALPRIGSVATLPAKFDLRAQNGLTPVQNQGACGSCWTFGSLGSLESSLLRATGQTNSFSEDHLNSFGLGTCCQGGHRGMATAYLARWDGPVSATDDPYPVCNISRCSDGSANVCAGVATAVVRKHVQEVWWLPVRGSATDNDTIKQAIYTYGAVETAINATFGSTAWNANTSALYDSTMYANHSVAIVGWDDSFPANNFITPPPGPGAFLMRNSWGTKWGTNGYFWISYYDATVGVVENTLYLNAEAPDNYTRNYQYDQFGNNMFVGYWDTDPAWGANIFTAVDAEELRAVSFYTMGVDAPYVINVYTNASVPASGSGPMLSGGLACTTSGIIHWPGYHTVVLPTVVSLTKNAQFAIAVQFAGNPAGKANIPASYNYLNVTNPPGRSLQSGDGTWWEDVPTKYWAPPVSVCIKAFTYAACNPRIATTSTNVSAVANSGRVAVNAAAGCPWTALANQNWLSITGGTSGTGTGAVTYSFTTNTTSSARTGTLTIAGQTFTVTQAIGSGVFSLATNIVNVGAMANSGSVTVFASGGYQWAATSGASWLSITGGASGTGTGTVSFTYTPNTVCSARTGSLTVGGQIVTVNQAAGNGTFVLFVNRIATNNAVAVGTASYGYVSIGTTVDSQTCPWTATANNDWLSIASGANGTGPGSVQYIYTLNPGCSPRTGTLTIAGQPFTITQAGGSGAFSLAANTATVGAVGNSGSVTVASSGSCAWTATTTNSWLSITSGASGTGAGTVNYTCAANSTCSARTGALTIAGQTFTVNQTGSSGSFTVTPSTMSADAAGNSSSVTVSGGSCPWTASANTTWLSITGGATGSGAGTVNYTCAANPSCAARSGSLTVAGQTITVNQAGASGTFGLSASAASVSAAGSCGSVTVSGNSGCPWTATSGNSWLSISPGSGSGTSTVIYCYTTNTIRNARSGSLTIAGQTFTVNQAAASGGFNLSTTNVVVGAAANCGNVTVYSTGGSPFTATSSNSWLTISTVTGARAGSGNAVVSGLATVSVNYCWTANPTNTVRTGSLTIAGQRVTVVQAGQAGAVSVPATNTVARASSSAGTGIQPGDRVVFGGLPIALLGEPVSFAAEGQHLTCAWNFGDGSWSDDCNPSHVFSNCGPQTVIVALSDGTTTVVSNQTILVACDLAITGLKLNLNFTRHTAACVATAHLPLAPTFSVTNQVLVLDVAGAQSTFVLNGAGRGVNSQGVCRLTYRPATADWQLTANLVGDTTWLTAWAEAGMSNATVRLPGSQVAIPVQLLIGTDAAVATTNLNYTATAGRTGQTR